MSLDDIGDDAGDEAWYDPSSVLSKQEQRHKQSDETSIEFDQQAKPIQDLADVSGITVCVRCGIYWMGKGPKHHRNEFGHRNCFMKRPAPPADRKEGWKDPFVLQSNEALQEQGIVHSKTAAADERRERLRQDGHGR